MPTIHMAKTMVPVPVPPSIGSWRSPIDQTVGDISTAFLSSQVVWHTHSILWLCQNSY